MGGFGGPGGISRCDRFMGTGVRWMLGPLDSDGVGRSGVKWDLEYIRVADQNKDFFLQGVLGVLTECEES